MPKRMTFKDKIRTRSGKCFDDDLIYVTTRDAKGRPRFVHGARIPENRVTTTQMINFGERMRNSVSLYRSLPVEFVNDLNRYTRVYNLQHRGFKKPISGYNLFIGVLGKQQTQLYSLFTVSQTLGNNLNEWIENKILKNINTDIQFIATII